MAARKKVQVEKAVNLTDQPERFRMGEMGYLGLRIFNGVTQDEIKQELNWPSSIYTYKDMSAHSAINAPLTLFENIISKATWTYKPPLDATEEEINRAKIINSMMTDMEQPWSEFIRDVLSSNIFGFAVHEKVYRKRLKANGSLFDDGIIGWKKLPLRAQESISKFIFSEDGNDVIAVQQNITNLSNSLNRYNARKNNIVNIPRSKFLLFRTGKHRGDPFGKSPLRDAYLAWRFLSALEELEAMGVAKDLNGIPVLTLPPQVLSADASPENQQQRSYFENALRNLQVGAQSAVILPAVFDEASGQNLYKLELLSADGKKNFDLNKIKDYYKNLIFTSLFSDILTLGQSATGSFALGSIKNSLSGAYAERLIANIAEVIQNDLIRQTYELNNWPTDRMGKLDFDGLDNTDTETFSKLVQRVASVGLLEVDRDVLNIIRKNIGVDTLPEEMPVQTDILSMSSSKSGSGMGTPFEGTRTSEGGKNDNDGNLDNAS